MLSPEEFFRLALDSGATVELVDGALRAEVKPRVVVAVDYKNVEGGSVPPPPTQLVPRENPGKRSSYPILKAAFEPWTSSHTAHIAAALGVMHGARTGEWSNPGVDAILKMCEKTDMVTLVACVQRATRYKQANKVDGQRPVMSTGAFAAAMYDAMQVDPKYNEVADLEGKLTGKKLLDTVLGLANSAELLGGSRSIEFRKQSYTACLQVFTTLR